VARKARALLEHLPPGPHAALERLLDQYVKAEGAARERAEEALLDFFLEHESRSPEP
jgi:molecular chaperone DnaK